MNIYTPQPGTIPARVIAHFKSLPAGTKLTSAVLAEALDIDTPSLGPCLEPAFRHGVITAQKIDGLKHWSLGSGQAPAPAERGEATDPLLTPQQIVVPVFAPPAKPRKPGATEKTPEPTVTAGLIAPAPAAPMRAALWSDGQLSIEKGGQALVLSQADTAALLHYLDRMAVDRESA